LSERDIAWKTRERERERGRKERAEKRIKFEVGGIFDIIKKIIG